MHGAYGMSGQERGSNQVLAEKIWSTNTIAGSLAIIRKYPPAALDF